MKDFEIYMLIGILLVIVTLITAFISLSAARYVGNLGALLWVFGGLLYVVFFDSKKRWPELSTWQRYVNVITFKR